MGILDSLRDKLLGGSADYYDEDEYYDDEEYLDEEEEEEEEEPARQPLSLRLRNRQETTQQTGSGLLGNTPRPEAESVSVYTRSGRPIVQGQSGTYESHAEERRIEALAAERQRTQRTLPTTGSGQRVAAGQLPPYVLRPTAYDDVQSVVRRVRTNQPVIIILTATAIDTARRILDFCFGFTCGIDGSVEELSERIFVVLPQGATISEKDIERLVADGEIQR